jgi:hypothetical protein
MSLLVTQGSFPSLRVDFSLEPSATQRVSFIACSTIYGDTGVTPASDKRNKGIYSSSFMFKRLFYVRTNNNWMQLALKEPLIPIPQP